MTTQEWREKIKAQVVNAYCLGQGNAITGNIIDEHKDIDAYTQEIMSLLTQAVAEGGQAENELWTRAAIALDDQAIMEKYKELAALQPEREKS